MTTNSKLIGGMLLIIGTSIGGGMLALPVSTAPAGITSAILFLFTCWAVMTAGALLILEVNLRLPAGSNMVSMAKSTLGLPGQLIAWLAYLFLLYTLLSAYISGGSDVFNALLEKAHMALPSWIAATLFTLGFSVIIYNGIRLVDYVNRGLMFGKLCIYALLVLTISPYMHLARLQGGAPHAIMGSIMILITSFGFATIVPSLREYFEEDLRSLRRAILMGSFIPLLCYILWITVIMGVVQRGGEDGLLALMNSEHATSGLTSALNRAVQSQWITGFFDFFTSICMLTAFLGVSLGLFDFLADGLQLKKNGSQGLLTLTLTFLPPLLVVLVNPGIYLQALRYAGTCCVVLLLLLPTMMAWQSRKISAPDDNVLVLPGGTMSLIGVGLVAVGLLVLSGVM